MFSPLPVEAGVAGGVRSPGGGVGDSPGDAELQGGLRFLSPLPLEVGGLRLSEAAVVTTFRAVSLQLNFSSARFCRPPLCPWRTPTFQPWVSPAADSYLLPEENGVPPKK